jgi:hypothetical protein
LNEFVRSLRWQLSACGISVEKKHRMEIRTEFRSINGKEFRNA